MVEMGLGRAVSHGSHQYHGTCPHCGERSVIVTATDDYGGLLVDRCEAECGCDLTESELEVALDESTEDEPSGPGHDEPLGD